MWGWTCCAWRQGQTVTQSLALRQELSAHWDAAQPGRGCCFGTYDVLCISNWIYTKCAVKAQSLRINAQHFLVRLFLQEIQRNLWECWASCFLHEGFLVQVEFLSGVLTGNSPQWAQRCSLNSILHNHSGMLCDHFTLPAGNLTDSSRQTQFTVMLFFRSDDTVTYVAAVWGIPLTGIWGLLVLFVCSQGAPDMNPTPPHGPASQPSLGFECLCQYLQQQPWFNSQPGWQS